MRRAAIAPRKQRGGSRKGLLTAASVILVAAVGAAAAMYLRTARAERRPARLPSSRRPKARRRSKQPEEQTAESGEAVGEAVYNRVAGNAPTTEEQVVDSAEEPREIARIVLPSQAESEDALVRSVGEEDAAASAAGADASAATETEGAAEEEIGPRRVQTFAVRPDGTIVRTDATAATPDPAGDQQQQLAAQTEQIEPVPVATVAIGDPSQAAERADSGAFGRPKRRPSNRLAQRRRSRRSNLPTRRPHRRGAPEAAPGRAGGRWRPSRAAIPAPSAAAAATSCRSARSGAPSRRTPPLPICRAATPRCLAASPRRCRKPISARRGSTTASASAPGHRARRPSRVCEALQGAGGTCFVTAMTSTLAGGVARLYLRAFGNRALGSRERRSCATPGPGASSSSSATPRAPTRSGGSAGAARAALGRDDAPILIDQEGGRVQRFGPPHLRAYPAGAVYGAALSRGPARWASRPRISARG